MISDAERIAIALSGKHVASLERRSEYSWAVIPGVTIRTKLAIFSGKVAITHFLQLLTDADASHVQAGQTGALQLIWKYSISATDQSYDSLMWKQRNGMKMKPGRMLLRLSFAIAEM